MLKPDPFGLLDISLAIILYYTATPVPEVFATAHIAILAFRGVITLLSFRVPMPGMGPVFLFVDLVSAGILMVSEPPLIAKYKEIISGLLFIKGGSMAARYFS